MQKHVTRFFLRLQNLPYLPLFLFIYAWMFELVPPLGCCDIYIFWYTLGPNISLRSYFEFWVNIQKWVGLVKRIIFYLFIFCRNLHTIFYNGYTILLSHQKYSWVPSLHFSSNNGYFLFFWYLPSWCMCGDVIVVLLCISLMISDDGLLFICLLVICISSLEICLFKHCSPFELTYLFYCYLYKFLKYTR